jgi:gamma-D-glutamyl-L-lysine dipeptidyl-peptidase
MAGIAVLALFAAALPNAAVLRPVANMYSKPSLDADVVSQAVFGANVALLEQRDGWARVRTADEYAGWIPMGDLRPGPPYAADRFAEVSSLFAQVYREADTTRHAPLVTLPFEARLEPVAMPAGGTRWTEVRLPGGNLGWIQTADITFARKPLTTAEMLALAKRFLGVAPYTWGGTSSYGFDCSGFTQMLERQRGVMMPRDAQPQADWSGATAVKRDDLQPGDLLFFGPSDKKITHTGVYLGEGKFIDATTYQTPTVRIDDLSDAHWTGQAALVAIRRVK